MKKMKTSLEDESVNETPSREALHLGIMYNVVRQMRKKVCL
jgi:hypothetical protein